MLPALYSPEPTTDARLPTAAAPVLRIDAPRAESDQRRDLYFFALYRVFEAALLALLVFSPFKGLIDTPELPHLARTAVVFYLSVSILLFLWGRRQNRGNVRAQVLIGTAIDITIAVLAVHALPLAAPGIALMLLFNIGAASLLLPLRFGLGGATIAAAAMMAEYIWSLLTHGDTMRPLAERLMFAVSYLAIAMLTYLLGRQMRESQALVIKRSAEVANLAELNELIIRRMRTGVLLVDEAGRIRLANEAAISLLANTDGERSLALIAPELWRRLRTWLKDDQNDDTPIAMGPEQTDVLPRFARLQVDGDSALVFLDDTSMVSRRAESMTLATLGRFSASLAHEIRNPLAAISYATQLMEESTDITAGDRRLLEIIHTQCVRTNGIVESVLGLARRERASAERIELVAFTRRFVDNYKQILPPETGTVQVGGGPAPIAALVDPRHLQQVLTVLLQNALTYGHLPGEAPRITLSVQKQEGRAVIDVLDRGPGVPQGIVAQLFRPFFTTSEHGTGLGLYIAGELCRANEATLDYIPVPAGGGCFRVVMPAPDAFMPSDATSPRSAT